MTPAATQTTTRARIIAAAPKLRALAQGRLHRPRQLLMVQNLVNEQWDGQGTARLLADPRRADALISDTLATAQRDGWQGVVFDIENIPDSALPAYRAMLERAHARFKHAAIPLVLTVPAGEPAWDLARFAAATDYLILMDYDQHWQGGEAGPIAAQDWFNQQLQDARRRVPQGKLIPPEEESFNHHARTCRVGPDGMLYITSGYPRLGGAPGNVLLAFGLDSSRP